MNNFIKIVLLALLLVACSDSAKDGYSFGTKSYTHNLVEVSVVTYTSREELRKAIKNPEKLSESVMAFSVLYKKDGVALPKCTIHMMDPAVVYEPEFVGHEFLHCVYGQWHTNNSSKQ